MIAIYKGRLARGQQTQALLRKQGLVYKRELKEAFGQYDNLSQLLPHAAGRYSEVRGNAAIFVRSEANAKLRVCSASGFLSNADICFGSQRPGALMMNVLAKGHRIHIPDLSAVINGKIMVELLKERDGIKQAVNPKELIDNLPSNFSTIDNGAVLINPLMTGRDERFAYGFILEYRRQGYFTTHSIDEAAIYAALFALEIAQRLP